MAHYAESAQKSAVETSDIQIYEDGSASPLHNIKIEISLADVLRYLNALHCTVYVATGFVFLLIAVYEYLYVISSPEEYVQVIQRLARCWILDVVTGSLIFIYILKVVNIPHTGFYDYCKKSWHLANWWFSIALSLTIGLVISTYVIYCIEDPSVRNRGLGAVMGRARYRY